MIFSYRSKPRLLHVVMAFVVLLFAACSLSYAATIRGTVTNKTSDKPSAGDDVVLIALTQNMQEVARTKTDASGRYAINATDDGMHLIRVDHQKASYFGAVTPGSTKVDVTVYDVAPTVKGVSTEAVMLRMETDGQGLHVIESYFVKNDSSPAKTQFGPHAFEIYLPSGAQIEASIAMGPGGMPVSSSPVPSDEKGRYSFIFPVRPGETRFQVSYHIPYKDSLLFQTKVSLPTANYAVVLPKSMTLTPGAGLSFDAMKADTGTQSLLTKNIASSQGISFTVAGSGALPRDSSSGQGSGDQEIGGQGAAAAPAADNRPGGGLGVPIGTPDPLDKYKWWILSGIAMVLAIGAGWFLRPGARSLPSEVPSRIAEPTISRPGERELWLGALKEELFVLETERLAGKLTEDEYAEQKSAFEILLKRALRNRK